MSMNLAIKSKTGTFAGVGPRTIFDNRYCIKQLLRSYHRYRLYEGIDTVGLKFVSIYLKQVKLL
jgi:hypothetical protein